MEETDSLHELIHSLSKNERRSFLLNNTLNKKTSPYYKLFLLLEKQEIYDEEKLIKQLKNSSFSKNLSRNKNYLYQLLLECLADEEDLDLLFLELLKKSKILLNKGLYLQAKKLADTIREKTKIVEREKFELINALLLFEMEIVSSRLNKDFHFNDIAIINRSLEKNSLAFNDYRELNLALFSLASYTNNFVLYNLDEKINNKLIASISEYDTSVATEKALSNRAKLLLLESKLYSQLSTNPKDIKSVEIALNNLLLFVDSVSKTFLVFNLRLYLKITSNIIAISHKIKAYQIINRAMLHINIIEKDIDKLNAKSFVLRLRVLEIKSAFLVEMNKNNELILLCKEKEDIIEMGIKNKIKYINSILVNLRTVNIKTGEFKKAFQIHHQIEQFNNKKANELNYLLQDSIGLLLAFELNEHLYFDTLKRSVERKIKQPNSYSKTEITLFTYLFKLEKAEQNKTAKNKLLLDLKRELIALSEIPEEKAIFELFNFLNWVESKLQNTTMEEISEQTLDE